MANNIRKYSFTFLKGLAMGAADVVPGVSGGTIAFISGIYEELLTTIDSLNLSFFTYWKNEGFQSAVTHYNLKFLGSLFLGIAISILSLAKVISFLLENHPILVWSFFFGLVVASILFIGKQIAQWNLSAVIAVILGTILAYYITIAIPGTAPSVWYYFLLSGFVAIIAMILPGVSGSFILVLMGSYGLVIGTLTEFQEALVRGDSELVLSCLIRLSLFALGCVMGLKIFSKALRWMFANFQYITLAVLTGFMIGSLNKIWPWKQVLSTRLDRHGVEVPLREKSILPTSYDGEPYVLYACIMAMFGFLILFLLERAAVKKTVNVQ